MKQVITIILTTIFSHSLFAQQITDETFNVQIISEDFEKKCNSFNIGISQDNYFILDNGDLLLSRNNNNSTFKILAKDSYVSDFILKTSFKIEPSENENSSIGVVLKSENNNAIIFEINNKGEYRCINKSDGVEKNLDNNTKNYGWTRNKIINKIDKYNSLELRSEKNIFEIYVNSKLLTTYFIENKKDGVCGIQIGSLTKSRVSYFNLFAKKRIKNENYHSSNKSNEEINASNNDSDLKELSLIKSHNFNDSIKNYIVTIEKTATLNNELTNLNLEQEKKIKSLNKDLEIKESTIKENIKTNKQLLKKNSALEKQIKLEKSKNSDHLENIDKIKKSSNFTEKKIKEETTLHEINNRDLLNSNNSLTINLANLNSKTKKLKDESSRLISKKNNEIMILKDNLLSLKSELSTMKINKDNDEVIFKQIQTNYNILKNQKETLETEVASQKKINKKIKENNKFLKNLFVLKDFELNGTKTYDISKEKITTNDNTDIKEVNQNKNFYTVQIGTYLKEVSNSKFNDIENLIKRKTKNTFIYYSGKFKTNEEATSHMMKLKSSGYKNSFVLIQNK